MAGTLVSYARFLEVRERRQQVVAEFMHLSTDRGHADRPPPPLTIDCEPLRDELCGTRPVVEAIRREPVLPLNRGRSGNGLNS